MGVSASDIIEGDEVEMLIDEVRPDNYVYRRAFRNEDATDANSDEIGIDNVDFDLGGEIMEIAENTSLSRVSFDQSETSAVFSEYGFEVPISDKAIKDGKLSQRSRAMEQIAIAEEQKMDSIAANVIENNRRSTTIGDTSGTLEYTDFTDAVGTLLENGYSRDQAEGYVDGGAYSTLMNMNKFEASDQLVEALIKDGDLGDGNLDQGLLGVLGGIPIYLSNADHSPLGAGQAYVVDRAEYGFEAVRERFSTDVYREDKDRQDVYQTTGRYDWLSTDDMAAVKIDS